MGHRFSDLIERIAFVLILLYLSPVIVAMYCFGFADDTTDPES